MRPQPIDHSQKHDSLRESCAVKATLDVIRGRWKPSILQELHHGTKRYSELAEALPQIAAQVLTAQLRQLEADGVITRTVYPEVPARVEYQLSVHGQQLSAVMDELEAWGAKYLARQAAKKSAAC